jgi:hypothetical protein
MLFFKRLLQLEETVSKNRRDPRKAFAFSLCGVDSRMQSQHPAVKASQAETSQAVSDRGGVLLCYSIFEEPNLQLVEKLQVAVHRCIS